MKVTIEIGGTTWQSFGQAVFAMGDTMKEVGLQLMRSKMWRDPHNMDSRKMIRSKTMEKDGVYFTLVFEEDGSEIPKVEWPESLEL